MLKRVTIELDAHLWALLRSQAKIEGRFVQAVAATAFRRYLRDPSSTAMPESQSAPVSGGTLDELQRSGLIKTARQLAQEREGRRGNEGGSQTRDDDL